MGNTLTPTTEITEGPWEVCIMDHPMPESPEDEWGIHVPGAPDYEVKPDGTIHSLIVCRGMIGPARVANAYLLSAAPEMFAVMRQTAVLLASMPRTPEIDRVEQRMAEIEMKIQGMVRE